MTGENIGCYGNMGVAESFRTNKVNQAKRVRIVRHRQ